MWGGGCREMDGGWRKNKNRKKRKPRDGGVKGGGCDGSKLTSHKLYLPG